MALTVSCLAHLALISIIATRIFSNDISSAAPQKHPHAKMDVRLISVENSKKNSAPEMSASSKNEAFGAEQANHANQEPRTLHTGYYSPSQVTYPAHVLSAIELDLEKKDLNHPLESGSAALRIYLNTDGRVEEIIIENNTMPSNILGTALLQFRNATYAPAIIGEQPVKSWIRIELTLRD